MTDPKIKLKNKLSLDRAHDIFGSLHGSKNCKSTRRLERRKMGTQRLNKFDVRYCGRTAYERFDFRTVNKERKNLIENDQRQSKLVSAHTGSGSAILERNFYFLKKATT